MVDVALLTVGVLMGALLGLVGGGGGIVAVPLLVYGASLPVREAVAASATVIAVTAAVGAVRRGCRGLVEWSTGLVFAAAGFGAAPFGALLARHLPETALLGAFALVMATVAVRMWQASGPQEGGSTHACRTPRGTIIWSSRCAAILLVAGLAAGFLSGLFGVGGGFIIVPALVLVTGMSMPRASGTSLLVISLISTAAVISHWLVGNTPHAHVLLVLLVSSLAGLWLGEQFAERLTGPVLQKSFAVLLLVVATVTILRNFFFHLS